MEVQSVKMDVFFVSFFYTGFLIPNKEHVILHYSTKSSKQMKGVKPLPSESSGSKHN